ncbi:unnamed protein product [Pleuronectes platessa]|uniref:Hydrophobin n=1 Tax=Pleuronectes platessa TaxID=8262 RepID=A0A9N7UGD2_PLEPL|nr:unnamed protein product [Pleuronectes platessa]
MTTAPFANATSELHIRVVWGIAIEETPPKQKGDRGCGKERPWLADQEPVFEYLIAAPFLRVLFRSKGVMPHADPPTCSMGLIQTRRLLVTALVGLPSLLSASSPFACPGGPPTHPLTSSSSSSSSDQPVVSLPVVRAAAMPRCKPGQAGCCSSNSTVLDGDLELDVGPQRGLSAGINFLGLLASVPWRISASSRPSLSLGPGSGSISM